MIIYEFTTWHYSSDLPFGVKEIEVEEKPKTYIGKSCRINKDDIGILQSSLDRMYLLENKPEIYINAMIARWESRVNIAELRLADTRKQLSKWSALAERKQESGQ